MFTWQTARISNLYEKRFEASCRPTALTIDGDLTEFVTAAYGLLFVRIRAACRTVRGGGPTGESDRRGASRSDRSSRAGQRSTAVPVCSLELDNLPVALPGPTGRSAGGWTGSCCNAPGQPDRPVEGQIQRIVDQDELAIRQADAAARAAIHTSRIVIWSLRP